MEKVWIVWCQFMDDPYAVEAERAFASELEANLYRLVRIQQLKDEGYIVYSETDEEACDEDEARVWIEDVEFKEAE